MNVFEMKIVEILNDNDGTIQPYLGWLNDKGDWLPGVWMNIFSMRNLIFPLRILYII